VVPDVGLVNAIEPDAAAAANGDRASAISNGIARSWSFILSP